MLSKVFNSSLCGLFKFQPATISTHFTFCTATSQRGDFHPLKNKIMSISTFDQFNSYFKEKGKQFDPSCYSVASRTLAKILIESKLFMTFQHRQAIKAFLSNLQKIDIEVLNLTQFSQLLYLLRIIKLDPNNNNVFVNQYIRLIIDRSDSKVKELQTDSSLNRLCYFYQQYSSLGSKQATIIAKRINSLLSNNNSEVEFQILAVNQINSVLKGMKAKLQLSAEQQILLRTIIRTVIEKYFDKLSFLELVQISVGINEIISTSNNEIISPTFVQQIHRKVLANIDEMDQKSIMYILNSKKTNNKTYNQIYKTIFGKILEEIQPNGESSFNELFTLRLFNGISDKVKLGSTSQQNQDKFFAFLRVTLTKSPRFIHSFVESFVEKGFFNFKQLLKLQQILESIPDFHLKLTLIYNLAKRNINVEKLISLDRLNDEIKDKSLVLMAFIVDKLAEREGSNKEMYKEVLGKLKERFFELYKVEDDSFSKLIFSLIPEHIESLNQTFRRQFDSKLPNPLQTEQSEKYRQAWLKLQIYGSTETFFNKRLGNQLKDKLTTKDMEYIFKTIIFEGYSNKQTLTNALTLIGKRMDLIIGNNNLTSSLVRLLTFEMNNIFSDNSTDLMKIRFWYILNECFQKTDGNKFIESFSLVIGNILKSRVYDFKYSSQYQAFLTRLLGISGLIKNKHMAVDLLSQCLNLNLIKREHIQNLSEKFKDSATTNQKLMLKMIETNQFVLQGIQLEKNNLYLFLANLSPETNTFISANRDKIISMIEQMKTRDLWRCISHYRLGAKRNEAEILQTLFKQLNKQILLYEDHSPIFLGDILRRNHLDRGYAKIENVKQFYKNSLDYFLQRRNISKIPLEDHVELIKTANDFKIRNDDYVHAVFEQYANDINIFKRELYLVAGQIGLELNDKEIKKLIDSNFFANFSSSFSKCFNIFIYNEKNLKNPDQCLEIIIKKYNEIKSNEKILIFSLYYEYLKKIYPEVTKNFQPNNAENADFCRNLESHNNKNLNYLREAIEEVTNEKWIENIVFGNYYYTFRNIAIIFPVQSKYYGENNILKKILSTLTGIEKFALINKRNSSAKSALKFLTQGYNGILSVQEEEKIMKKIDEKYQQFKENNEEAQAVEEPEQKLDAEKSTAAQ